MSGECYELKQKDIKLLCGRAASRCSICKEKLSEVSNNLEGLLIGEQAHIIGEKENAARGNSNLSVEERNSYHNLILLCPNHHTIIDKDTKTYTIEKLHMIKSEHELWVEEKLATLNDTKELANDIVYTHLIDSMTELCHFHSFDDWISMLCSPSININSETYYGLCGFRNMVFKAIFPGSNKELERAIRTFAIVIGDLLDTYGLHLRYDNGYYSCDRFYRNNGFNNQDLDKFNDWENRITDICFEVTKIINWVSDVIRRDINPLFYVKEGKFTVSVGPDMNLNHKTYLVELTDDGKLMLPNSYKPSNLDEYK